MPVIDAYKCYKQYRDGNPQQQHNVVELLGGCGHYQVNVTLDMFFYLDLEQRQITVIKIYTTLLCQICVILWVLLLAPNSIFTSLVYICDSQHKILKQKMLGMLLKIVALAIVLFGTLEFYLVIVDGITSLSNYMMVSFQRKRFGVFFQNTIIYNCMSKSSQDTRRVLPINGVS